MTADMLDHYVIGRDRNVVRVNFAREPEPPPPPPFPGAGAMRACVWQSSINAFSASIKTEVA